MAFRKNVGSDEKPNMRHSQKRRPVVVVRDI